MDIIRIPQTDSTNTYAKQLIYDNKLVGDTCIVTNCQTEGKGQGNNVWVAAPGKNLTFSLVCFPQKLAAARQFQLTQVTSISVTQLLKRYVPAQNIQIKWPNDIYINNEKVAGILIENSISGADISWTVIGIGININQEDFGNPDIKATSLIKHFEKTLVLDLLLEEFLQIFETNYNQLFSYGFALLDQEYLQQLYRKNVLADYRFKGEKIRATITGVNEFGWLLLTKDSGEKIEAELKMLKFL